MIDIEYLGNFVIKQNIFRYTILVSMGAGGAGISGSQVWQGASSPRQKNLEVYKNNLKYQILTK